MIELKIEFEGKRADGGDFKESDAREVVEQLKRDSTYGTFGNIPEGFWDALPGENHFSDYVEDATSYRELVPRGGGDSWKRYSFELKLHEKLFDVAGNGLQHLAGVLAGDLFSLSMPHLDLRDFSVESLDLGGVKETAYNLFREGRPHSIEEIRQAFELCPLQPLLAYTIKPRVGLSVETIRELTRIVASEGFHIIELDTRYLKHDEELLEGLVRIASELAEGAHEGSHVARFSPNLSLDPTRAIEWASRFAEEVAPPCVIKIDGGLDGMTACQQVRLNCDAADHSLVTCYPLLKNALGEYLGGGATWVELMSLCGADIIYPGGCPRFSKGGYRHIDQSSLLRGQERYNGIVETGWPMPTVAGGVHAGELHAYYELLGPEVAYFIGGGVSLHKDGPKAGAALCRKVIDRAVEAREQAIQRGGQAENLTGDLVESLPDQYDQPGWMDDEVFEYLPPSNVFDYEAGLKRHFE